MFITSEGRKQSNLITHRLRFRKIMRARDKRIIITTTLANTNKVRNSYVREIFIKYVSNLQRAVDVDYCLNKMNTEPYLLLDIAGCWYNNNVSNYYKSNRVDMIFS